MEAIDLSLNECQELIKRLERSNLGSDDQYLLKRIITGYVGLEAALKEKNISIRRLKEIAFGQKQRKSYGLKHNSRTTGNSSNGLGTKTQQTSVKTTVSLYWPL